MGLSCNGQGICVLSTTAPDAVTPAFDALARAPDAAIADAPAAPMLSDAPLPTLPDAAEALDAALPDAPPPALPDAPPRPTVVIVMPSAGTTTGPGVNATFQPGARTATVVCTLDGAPITCTTTGAILPLLSGGTHTLTAQAKDDAGDGGPVASVTWSVDAMGPAVDIVAPADGSSVCVDPSSSISLSEPGTATCSLDGDPHACDGELALTEGTHTFTAGAVDVYGNQGPESSATFTIDTSVSAGVVRENGSTGCAFDWVITIFSDEPPGSVTLTCVKDGGAAGPCQAGDLVFPGGGAQGDAHSIMVHAVDRCGNTSDGSDFCIVSF